VNGLLGHSPEPPRLEIEPLPSHQVLDAFRGTDALKAVAAAPGTLPQRGAIVGCLQLVRPTRERQSYSAARDPNMSGEPILWSRKRAMGKQYAS
jgi:hypothetical protein